ncbi:hypothetical protein EUX98_g4366 [Antrodiella citrinella]|uniref:N-acetyltransferase domain-containing protein n=1 Tax=Antrodiella citrinella TaxID=2447956 RepID=A0A4S4MU36_9APHY|nr:hypothetical protein EUX98_g4366 [Antrodiella citrinella]
MDKAFLSTLDPDLREWYNEHYASKCNELRICTDTARKERGFWTLHVLAVVPESRRKGVGKALVDVIVKKADAANVSMITDVRDPSTVHFFQRSGFKYCCVKNVMSQGSPGFPIWRMYRDPPTTG